VKPALYAITTFLGSFLLFLVEPMAAKRLLPVHGGAAAVWTTSLLFFQIALLVGYAYANWARPRQHAVFTAVTIVGLLLRAVSPPTEPPDGLSPILSVFWSLTASIGVPFIFLAAGSTLLQRWAQSYRLYAISNAGSLLALIAYPALVEPLLGWKGQHWVWTSGALLYSILILFCIWNANDVGASQARVERPEGNALLWWIAFSASGSALLSAATSQICQEVASIPFLWILPLSIYLLSFVLVFSDGEGWWKRLPFWNLLAPVTIAMAIVLLVAGPRYPYLWSVGADLLVLTVCLMICNIHLAKSKPRLASLGWFYLAIAAGGALGGLFTAVLAPLLFQTHAEFPILLSLCAALGLARGLSDGDLTTIPVPILNRARIFALGSAAVIPLGTFSATAPGVLEERRNFYGVLRVTERAEIEGATRTFTHGRTKHGTQFVARPDLPTAYYTGSSGVAHALAESQRAKPQGIRAAVIGLGAGTLAHYARPQDRFRFYELDPDVEALARKHFSYLEGKPVEVVLGDARLRLMQEPAQGFDLLIVDAFSSDSIPVHLLTREAVELYQHHVAKPDGVIVLHISNRVLDLESVTRGIARHLDRSYELVVTKDQFEKGAANSSWVLLRPGRYRGPAGILWTDSYSSLWTIFKIR
jgi:hypothetical protein